MRSIRTYFVILLATAAVATDARADNGLQRFEREIKPQLEVQKLSYRTGEALGDQGFVLSDVVAVMPPGPETGNKPSTVTIEKVTVEAIDFDRLGKDSKDELPHFLKMKLEGVTGDDTATSSLAAYGLPKVPADVTLDYRLDAATKRLVLNKLEIGLRDLGRIELALVMDGVSAKSSDVDDTRESGRLQSASLTIDDKGIAAGLLRVNAKNQGSTPEALVAIGLLTISGLASQQDSESVKAFDSVASFVGDWQSPKGPITFTLSPAKGASVADLGALMMPNALRQVLGLEVTYPGTRPGAAVARPTAK